MLKKFFISVLLVGFLSVIGGCKGDQGKKETAGIARFFSKKSVVVCGMRLDDFFQDKSIRSLFNRIPLDGVLADNAKAVYEQLQKTLSGASIYMSLLDIKKGESWIVISSKNAIIKSFLQLIALVEPNNKQVKKQQVKGKSAVFVGDFVLVELEAGLILLTQKQLVFDVVEKFNSKETGLPSSLVSSVAKLQKSSLWVAGDMRSLPNEAGVKIDSLSLALTLGSSWDLKSIVDFDTEKQAQMISMMLPMIMQQQKELPADVAAFLKGVKINQAGKKLSLNLQIPAKMIKKAIDNAASMQPQKK